MAMQEHAALLCKHMVCKTAKGVYTYGCKCMRVANLAEAQHLHLAGNTTQKALKAVLVPG